jgi:hypothetical protein
MSTSEPEDKMPERRVKDLLRFYEILDTLEQRIGGARTLTDSSGKLQLPKRGVYFFREPGEVRTDTGTGPRVVRVGTHALKHASRTKLWHRLSSHKGAIKHGGGKHRTSIFRLIVGASLIAKNGYAFPTWGVGNSAKSDVTRGEHALECEVSRIIGEMPFLWLAVEDEPGPDSVRGYIERNAIALVSKYRKLPVDPPSPQWLGQHCDREKVRESGLWNSDHVEKSYDPAFMAKLEQLVSEMPVVR